MEELYTRFDGVFFEKTRLSIMTLLNQEEKLAFNALKERLGGSDGAIYTHLEKLVAAGYAAKEREIAAGTPRTVYTLTQEGRRTFADYIEFLAELLARSQGDRPGTPGTPQPPKGDTP